MATGEGGESSGPTDRELILDYLLKKLTGQPLPPNCIVRERDVYGDEEPWDLFGGCKERSTAYFFTKLKKKNKSRFNRTVGDKKGTWKGQDKATPIFDHCQRLVGFKRSFFYESNGSPKPGRWIMKEFCLDGISLNHSNCQDFVLCRIKQNRPLRKLSPSASEESPCFTTQSAMTKELEPSTVEQDREQPMNENDNGMPLPEEIRPIYALEQSSTSRSNDGTQTMDIDDLCPAEAQGVPYDGDATVDHCDDDIHWTEWFAKELLGSQQDAPQDTDIQMLPNPNAACYSHIW